MLPGSRSASTRGTARPAARRRVSGASRSPMNRAGCSGAGTPIGRSCRPRPSSSSLRGSRAACWAGRRGGPRGSWAWARWTPRRAPGSEAGRWSSTAIRRSSAPRDRGPRCTIWRSSSPPRGCGSFPDRSSFRAAMVPPTRSIPRCGRPGTADGSSRRWSGRSRCMRTSSGSRCVRGRTSAAARG